ncbi:MAG: hypothetical protein ACOC0P_00640 [Planctomycetota bacterium]
MSNTTSDTHVVMATTIFNTAALAAALFCAAAAPAGQQYEYALFDLGDLGETNNITTGINEVGDVCGTSPAAGGYHAFLWEEPGPMQDLGVLPGGLNDSVAEGLNNLGWVVGSARDAMAQDQPVLWRDGDIVVLSGEIPGTGGVALDVNDTGTIVGDWREDLGEGNLRWTGFIFHDNVMTRLTKPYSDQDGTSANAINELGHIAGIVLRTPEPQQAFLWIDDTPIYLPWLEPEGGSIAEDVNDNDEVAGWGRRRGDVHAWFWSDGVMRDIHSLGKQSYSNGLNNFGEVVGFSTFSDTLFDWAGFRWSLSTGMYNLNFLIPPMCPYHIISAKDINDAGQIAADAGKGAVRFPAWSVLLTPVHATMTLAPTYNQLVAGEPNGLIVTNATPGARVYFAWSEMGGGAYMPGCTLQENALQLQNPRLIGSTIASGSGIARLDRFIPQNLAGRTILIQALIPGECTVSELIMETIQ